MCAGLQYPVPPLSGSNTRREYDDPPRRHGQQGHSASQYLKLEPDFYPH